MAMPTPDLRLGHFAQRLGALSPYYDAAPQSQETGLTSPFEVHERASVGEHDPWHRASGAEIRGPRSPSGSAADQATFLLSPPAVEILVVVRALRSRRCTHERFDPGPEGSGAREVLATAGVDADRVPRLDEQRNLNPQSGLGRHVLVGACGGVAPDADFRLHPFELNRSRQFDLDRLVLVESQLDLSTVGEVVHGIAERLRAQCGLLEGLRIHEMIEIDVLVEELNDMVIKPYVLN